jgi:hypothetical protein
MEDGSARPARRKFFSLITALSLSILLSPALDLHAGEGRLYKVRGTVVAVTLNQTPPIIVVNTPLGPKNQMSVGASVTAQTKILRGDKRIGIQSIKVGEDVWLSYVKSPSGLQARLVKVK